MRQTFLALLVVSLCAVAFAEPPAELFTDKAETYVRAGSRSGMTVGQKLLVFSDAAGAQRVGSGMVMEVWESMSRVSLDEAAKKGKARFAARDVPAEPLAQPPPPPATTPLSARPLVGPPLRGHVQRGNMGRIIIYNDSDTHWTGCEARLPDDSVFRFGQLAPRSDEGILSIKFLREGLPANDRLAVQCDQGEASFPFGYGRNEGSLKGHAERGHVGRIIVHNDGDTDWTRCVLRLPDSTSYVLGSLRAHSDEGVMPTRFRLEAATNYLVVRCQQGDARFDFR